MAVYLRCACLIFAMMATTSNNTLPASMMICRLVIDASLRKSIKLAGLQHYPYRVTNIDHCAKSAIKAPNNTWSQGARVTSLVVHGKRIIQIPNMTIAPPSCAIESTSFERSAPFTVNDVNDMK